jgi:hypothetical protein
MNGPPNHKPCAEGLPLESQPPIRRRYVRIHNYRVKTNWKKTPFGDLEARGPFFHQAPMQKQLVLVGVLQRL